jgi:hypothetical protein
METWVAILIGAAGTWLVAIFAIWGEKIRSWLFKPTLEIGEGEFSGTTGRHAGDRTARYYKVPVRNPKRFPPAREVQLVLTRIEKSGAHGPEVIFDEIMPITWERQELYPLLTRTIGSDQIASLFFIQEDGVLGFTPAVTPTGTLAAHFPREHKGAITLWVTLRAVSIEADSPSTRLRIDWDGQWPSDKVGLSGICRVTVDPA